VGGKPIVGLTVVKPLEGPRTTEAQPLEGPRTIGA